MRTSRQSSPFRGRFVRVSGLETRRGGPAAPIWSGHASPGRGRRPGVNSRPGRRRHQAGPGAPASGPGRRPRPGQSCRGGLHLAWRHHPGALQGPGAGLGRELPAVRQRGLLHRHRVPSCEERLHDSGRRLHRVPGRETHAPADSERSHQRPAQRCAAPSRWPAARRSAAPRRSSISMSSTTGRSTTPAIRPTSSAMPCLAACSPAWTSPIASPPFRPAKRADMDDVPVEPVIIKSVRISKQG